MLFGSIWRRIVLKEHRDITFGLLFFSFSHLLVLAFVIALVIRRRASSVFCDHSSDLQDLQIVIRECRFPLSLDLVFSGGIPPVFHFFLRSTRRLPVFKQGGQNFFTFTVHSD